MKIIIMENIIIGIAIIFCFLMLILAIALIKQPKTRRAGMRPEVKFTKVEFVILSIMILLVVSIFVIKEVEKDAVKDYVVHKGYKLEMCKMGLTKGIYEDISYDYYIDKLGLRSLKVDTAGKKIVVWWK